MQDRTSVAPIVTLCDPRGTLIWTNHPNPAYAPGAPLWDYADEANRELVKDQIARASFLNEPQECETSTSQGEHYHVWIWPIKTDHLGVCVVGVRMPDEIKTLTTRERECLEMLSMGHSTSEISQTFDVSVSTVHTYMKRAREKLQLSSMEQLIAFASRYLPPKLPSE